MARMIPAMFSENCSSPGEREIFHRLKHAPETRYWIVLHSLDLANHRKKIVGEIDFVIIVPNLGILCLEVKAHEHIRRDNGVWFYGSRSAGDRRGPFRQAADGMHSLRKHLAREKKHLSRILFWSAVAFPYADFDIMSPEWHPWQVIDGRLFRSMPFERIVIDILQRAREHVLGKLSGTWLRMSEDQPTPDQCAEIAEFFRPSFEVFESARSRLSRVEADLKRFTAEQFGALDAMEENDRAIFSGPAGTGKTFLALESARRASERNSKVLLVCFNRLLAQKLQEETSALRHTVEVRTIHSYMLSLVGKPDHAYVLSAAPSDYWTTELPSQAVDKLLEKPGEIPTFDELIVDEAQDILRDSYLDVLDLSLRGGLGSGRWRMFGDFDKQHIYSSANLDLRSFITSRGNMAPVYRLRTNCRNTPRVGVQAELLGGLRPGYKEFRRPDDEREPEKLYYRDPQHQEALLAETLERLINEGVEPHHIVVLSLLSNTHSAPARMSAMPWRDLLKPYEVRTEGQHIGYASTHAFKGLEAPIVIVTDVSNLSEENRDLLYVAVTRALDRLLILFDEAVKEDLIRLLDL